MDLIGRHQAKIGMVVVLVVPGEEAAAKVLGVLDAAEAFGKFGLVFEGPRVCTFVPFNGRGCSIRTT
jgi:hypothetical protein